MSKAIRPDPLLKCFVAEGLIPEGCLSIWVTFAVDCLAQVHYSQNVVDWSDGSPYTTSRHHTEYITPDKFAALSRAFQAYLKVLEERA